MNSNSYYGLGRAVADLPPDLFDNSTMVKSSGRVSLMETESPAGTNYVVVLDYGEVNAEILFPTPANPARSGDDFRTFSASEAYAKFDEMVAIYGGISTDASGITGRAASFGELDTYLLSSATLPVDIINELQRAGMASTGRPKNRLNLQFRGGVLSRIVGQAKDGMRMARLYYESYPSEVRILALKDMRPRVLEKYMTGDLISSMIMTNKEKRRLYQQALMEDRYAEIPLSEALDSMTTVGQTPVVALRVRFIDQKGNEVRGLPYEITCRGALNFIEAAKATKFGSDVGLFSAGKTLTELGMSGMGSEASDAVSGSLVENWSGRSLAPDEYYHLLYKYRPTGSEGLPPGAIKIQVNTPRKTNSMQDWGNSRLMVYPSPSNASETREGEPTKAKPKTILFSHNYRLDKNDSTLRLTVTVPVHVEPLPMHLVEMPARSGNVVSRWSVTEDIGAIPGHQKINLSFKVLRPTASSKWEEADANGDGILQYDEFTSPEGRAAYRESINTASPVQGVKFALIPDNSNMWITSRSLTILSPDFNGVMSAEVTPGTYRLKMLVQVKADGTTGLQPAIEGTPEHKLASRYDSLSSDLKSAIKQKYPTMAISRGTMFVPETMDIGIIEAPAGFFYREPNEADTTPVGAVGAKITKTGSLADLGASRFRNFKLEQTIPALPRDKKPEAGSIYDMMGIDFPTIDAGWPSGNDTGTDARFFDTATIFLAPDSSIDLSMLQAYEQRYEAQRNGGGVVQSRLIAPAVGQKVEYNGYVIEHLLFDTSVGPRLTNQEDSLRGGVQEYDMGKINTPFFEVGVVRAMVFYPASGIMRRKVVIPGAQKVNPNLKVISRQTASQFNPTQASMDRVYYFDVKASPEGAVLSGRWVPLETIGEYAMSLTPENEAFQKILNSIRRGGLPIRDSPKWNQFWSTTADGWMFGGNVPEPDDDNARIEVGDGRIDAGEIVREIGEIEYTGNVGGNNLIFNMAGTPGRLEGEGGLYDALVAPQPDYGEFDEDMGFVEG
ncbi:MAG: hypothetical protein CME55_00020 [Halieaceae bacterium]|nr:hypothetical protein [Halieaceae bacterium]